jgi:hypothetical protein
MGTSFGGLEQQLRAVVPVVSAASFVPDEASS